MMECQVVRRSKYMKKIMSRLTDKQVPKIHIFRGVFIRWNGTVEWNGGMERWNGIVEWNGGIVE